MSNTKRVRIAVADFHQETNSFNERIWTMDDFRQDTVLHGEAIIAGYGTKSGKTLCGIIEELQKADVQIVPTVAMRATSGGPVAHEVVEQWINAFLEGCKDHRKIDALVIGLHGATQSTQEEDVCGYILKTLRGTFGDEVVISVACDLHANITEKCMSYADFICGFQTYPHIDQKETGARAAKLALRRLEHGKPLYVAKARLPMLIPASGYTSEYGPFREIVGNAHEMVHTGELVDYSIFMVQPWLDVTTANTCVLTVSVDPQTAKHCASRLAEQLWNSRTALWPALISQEEAVDLARKAPTAYPVVLADFSDSPGAGANGSGIAPLPLLKRMNYPVHTAMIIANAALVEKANQIGVGNRGTVALRTYNGEEIELEIEVSRLQGGVFYQEGPVGCGQRRDLGKTAALRVANVDILACEHACGLGDLQAYRAFGFEPTEYQLVCVKANNSFYAGYGAFADRICMCDTQGAASSMLCDLPFRHIPRPFYPFDALHDYAMQEPAMKKS